MWGDGLGRVGAEAEEWNPHNLGLDFNEYGVINLAFSCFEFFRRGPLCRRVTYGIQSYRL